MNFNLKKRRTATINDLSQELLSLLSKLNDREFAMRVWTTQERIYTNRLRAIQFANLGRVLDAGSGMGQWTAALASLNDMVVALEYSEERLNFSNAVFKELGLQNVSSFQGSIAQTDFRDNEFDGIFCYSVMPWTDYQLVLREMYRILKPGGRFYMNANGLGWYIHNIIEQPNASNDFSPRQKAVETLDSTIQYLIDRTKYKTGDQLVLTSAYAEKLLGEIGFRIIAKGAEGKINLGGTEEVIPFFSGDYYGFEGVYEIVAG